MSIPPRSDNDDVHRRQYTIYHHITRIVRMTKGYKFNAGKSTSMLMGNVGAEGMT